MDGKYKMAVKAGLICALLIVVDRLVTNAIFYWALTRPELAAWVSQQSGATPAATGNMPAEALIAGVAIVVGGLLVFAIFMLAGGLAAFHLARQSKSLWDVVLPGAVAGAISQAVSAPFGMLMVLFMDIFPAYGEPDTSVMPWLVGQLFYQYVPILAIAIVLAAITALACGFVFRALSRNRAAA